MTKPIVITGGPGAGKTTIINALAKMGHNTYEESSRRLIEEQSALEDGILPWHDMAGFVKLCSRVMGDQKLQAVQDEGYAFLDRATGDLSAYMIMSGLTPTEELKQAALGYHSTVFVCRPNDVTYVQDEVRPYPFEQAIEIHELLVTAYEGFGYEVVEVPFDEVFKRCEFILTYLAE
ncbi:AAA family ATPase [Vibrio sp. SCSIO 43136]|uniref:AAA family ATPase n=1 Tax=Vibrio sp. SCSIO 43136 TaxID=2819101 RepID=UPI002075A691|nr:AAA family ATPase [Vibrio sp. SCSIO 43136]USD65198.1 AAA family ATPase [Vibrio sp. SCSIO 43136]